MFQHPTKRKRFHSPKKITVEEEEEEEKNKCCCCDCIIKWESQICGTCARQNAFI